MNPGERITKEVSVEDAKRPSLRADASRRGNPLPSNLIPSVFFCFIKPFVSNLY